MAAFVGNHHCVSVINNHVPKENVLYYTKWVIFVNQQKDAQKYGTVPPRKQPFEEQPKLSPELAKPLHNLVMSMNTHPVRYCQVVIYCKWGKVYLRIFLFAE